MNTIVLLGRHSYFVRSHLEPLDLGMTEGELDVLPQVLERELASQYGAV
jgi:hypothetical protein